MAILASFIAASSQPRRVVTKRSREGPDPGHATACAMITRHLPDTNPDRRSMPAGVLFFPAGMRNLPTCCVAGEPFPWCSMPHMLPR
jgi:hypothetical protein